MDGLTLKHLLLPLDESLANIARNLGMTPQSLDNMLKTKDIKTGIIERIARLYKKPISYFYNEDWIIYGEDIKIEEYKATGEKGFVAKKIGKVDQRNINQPSFHEEYYKNKLDTLQEELLEARAEIIKLMKEIQQLKSK